MSKPNPLCFKYLVERTKLKVRNTMLHTFGSVLSVISCDANRIPDLTYLIPHAGRCYRFMIPLPRRIESSSFSYACSSAPSSCYIVNIPYLGDLETTAKPKRGSRTHPTRVGGPTRQGGGTIDPPPRHPMVLVHPATFNMLPCKEAQLWHIITTHFIAV